MGPTLETGFQALGLSIDIECCSGAVSSKALPKYYMDRAPNKVGLRGAPNQGLTPRAMLVRPTIGVALASWPMGLLVMGRLSYIFYTK